MTQSEKGKNIFQAAIDFVSNRDEKAAIEAAMKHSQELEQRITQMEQSDRAVDEKVGGGRAARDPNRAETGRIERKVT